MSQNYYNLYLDSVLQLAETLVIKSEYTALRINEYMQNFYGADSFVENDKRTWKYYLNLSGEYHDKDEKMTVSSLDTLETIEFTKANLALHKATAAAYQYNSRYYRELVYRYPEQEQLIQGILYPADIDTAIAAPDFSILSYPSYLIEDNEISLVTNINKWLENFDIRWNNKQFTISDDWYGASVLGVMYLQLAPLILNLRLRACKTPEAHSFHVREYLASHGMLDVYLSKMTRKQALFFYRNINYIDRNSGKQDTFNWLVEKIMTDRNLPLSEYNMHHSVSGMPASLTPEVYFKKKLLNQAQDNNAQADISYSVSAILKKEQDLAPDNSNYSDNNLTHIGTLFKRSLSSTLPTKLLESSMVDYSDAVPYTLHQVYLNQWIQFTRTNRFNTTYIRIKSPKTGKELVMTTQDAYLYYLYAFAKVAGVTLITVPQLFAMRTQIEPTPTVEQLMAVVDEDYVTQDDAVFVRSLHASIGAINTLDDFRDTCKRIHTAAMQELYFVYQQESLTTRAMVYNMVHRLYQDVWFASPDPIISYEVWITSKGLEFSGFQDYDWQKVYEDIYEQITGVDMSNSENTYGIQKAMVALLQQLSSYSIQIISDINSDAIKAPNWNTVRVDQVKGVSKTYQEILLGIFKIFDRSIYPKDYEHIELDYLLRDFTIKNEPTDGGFIEVPIDVTPDKTEPKDFGVMDLGIFRLNQDNLPLSAIADPATNYQNYQAFFAMSAEDKAKIKNIYCECPKPFFYPEQADMTDIILYEGVPGLKYQAIAKDYFNIANYYYLPDVSYNFTIKGQETELDCFYPNFDPEWLENFNLNTGSQKLENFSLFIEAPLENEMPHFKFTGGWEYLSVFSPAKLGDDERTVDGLYSTTGELTIPKLDITSVSSSVGAFQMTTNTMTVTRGLNIVYLNQNLSELQIVKSARSLELFKSVVYKVDFSFKSIINTFESPEFVFNQMPAMTSVNALNFINTGYNCSAFGSNHDNRTLDSDLNYLGAEFDAGSLTLYYNNEDSIQEDLTYPNYKATSVDGFKNVTSVRSLPKDLKAEYSTAHLNVFERLIVVSNDARVFVMTDADDEIQNLDILLSSEDSQAYSWLESFGEYEINDPTFDDDDGVVWE